MRAGNGKKRRRFLSSVCAVRPVVERQGGKLPGTRKKEKAFAEDKIEDQQQGKGGVKQGGLKIGTKLVNAGDIGGQDAAKEGKQGNRRRGSKGSVRGAICRRAGKTRTAGATSVASVACS